MYWNNLFKCYRILQANSLNLASNLQTRKNHMNVRHYRSVRKKTSLAYINISTSLVTSNSHSCVEVLKRGVDYYACSISTRTPSQSLGWRNITGLPWAPIRGSGESSLISLAFRSAIAEFISSTYKHQTSRLMNSTTNIYHKVILPLIKVQATQLLLVTFTVNSVIIGTLPKIKIKEQTWTGHTLVDTVCWAYTYGDIVKFPLLFQT